jgi:uncharacterized protein YecT (DUF1311 family)
MWVPVAITAVALCFACSSVAGPQSFDCRTPTSARERVTCGHDEAGQADRDMADAYAAARRRLPRALSEALRLDQKAFLEALDDGFNAEMWAERAEATAQWASTDLRRVPRENEPQLQRLIAEIRNRTLFLSGVTDHRDGFAGIWRNAEASLTISADPAGGSRVVYASPSYGWPKYACGFRITVASTGDDLVGERPFNTDVGEPRDARLVFHRDEGLLRMAVNPDDERSESPCRHVRDWTKPFFPVALGAVH